MSLSSSHIETHSKKSSVFKEKPPYLPNGQAPVVTRFAPSPTGFLHLGGARTALFNWLFARHYDGRFLLRLEDTDLERSKEEFTQNIIETLQWLGLNWDDTMVVQSRNQQRHKDIALQLLQSGHGYRCYCTPEELEDMKKEALAQKKPPIYNGKWRDVDPSTYPKDQPFVVRLKAPREGHTSLLDGVQGSVTVDNKTLDDMVLLRSDGTPTYMLAVVVDDHDMGVTHIIRGDDHLTNAFRQLQLYEALGWTPPFMYHVPLIHDIGGKKLSKRLGAKDSRDYKEEGILPEALVNALLRLGWSHGDEEKITLDQAIEWFDGLHLSKGPARFDEKKLLALNSHYLRRYNAQELWDLCVTFDPSLNQGDKGRGLLILPSLAQRAKTIKELTQMLRPYLWWKLHGFFKKGNHQVTSPWNHLGAHLSENQETMTQNFFKEGHLQLNELSDSLIHNVSVAQETITQKEYKAFLQEQGFNPQDLRVFYDTLKKDLDEQKISWTQEDLSSWLSSWCEEKNIDIRGISKNLRLSLLGSPVSPPLPLVLEILGNSWILLRLENTLSLFL